MRPSTIAAIGLIFLAAASGAMAQDRGSVPVEPAPATPSPDPSPGADENLNAAGQAIQDLDVDRLMRDRAYAEQIIHHLDRLAEARADDEQAIEALDRLRLFALPILERKDETRRLIDREMLRQPREPQAYVGPAYAAWTIEDWDRLAAVVDTASVNISGLGWAELRSMFPVEMVGPLMHQLDADDRQATRVRLAGALLRIGWPGDGDTEAVDFIRTVLLEDRIEQGDAQAASDFAASIVTPASILPMVVQSRFDTILAPGQDRLDVLRRALEERDRETAAAIAASPENMGRVLDRVRYLRSTGRDEDALALIMPFTRDIPATVAAGSEGLWLVNEGAYCLLALGRADEAVALMRRLVALPIADNGSLISPNINYLEILWAIGRPADALRQANDLERDASDYASDYGKMWIVSTIVCALAGLDRAAEAAPRLAWMRERSDRNSAALTRAHLCLGDDEAAAALMVQRLADDDPEQAILALQDYQLRSGAAQAGPLLDRLEALRDRPEVRTALGRVGRVLSLPLARTYWGSF